MTFPSLFKSKLPTRRTVHACFWLFLIAAPLFYFRVIDIDHDFEWLLAYLFVLSAILLFLPQLFFELVPGLRDRGKEQALGTIEFILVIATILSWIGAMGPYRWDIGFDSFVHFSSSALAAVALYAFAYVMSDSKSGPSGFGVLAALIVITLALGIIVELGEWSLDAVFGSAAYGEAGQPGDTTRDIVYDTLGAIVGSALIIKHRKSFTKYIDA
ncbi:MAG: hypothetical protein ABIA47_00255 [bacterium]